MKRSEVLPFRPTTDHFVLVHPANSFEHPNAVSLFLSAFIGVYIQQLHSFTFNQFCRRSPSDRPPLRSRLFSQQPASALAVLPCYCQSAERRIGYTHAPCVIVCRAHSTERTSIGGSCVCCFLKCTRIRLYHIVRECARECVIRQRD